MLVQHIPGYWSYIILYSNKNLDYNNIDINIEYLNIIIYLDW